MLTLLMLALAAGTVSGQQSNFNNNVDPFGRRAFGAGDLSNAIFVEP